MKLDHGSPSATRAGQLARGVISAHKRRLVNNRIGPRLLLMHLLLFTALLAGCVAPIAHANVLQAMPAVSTQLISSANALSKLQPYLREVAVTDPHDHVRVIVQYQGDFNDFTAQVAAVNGVVMSDLAFINASVITIAAGDLPLLARHTTVRWIALDAPVRKSSATDGSADNARDDFDRVAYDGSSGAVSWAMDWQEIGEADGPAVGNVMVTSFWGGALQGLRLRGAQMGVLRAVDLGVAQHAQVGIAYRRKDFGSEQEYVAIEFSQDGGATWQEVTRIGDAGTDAAIQYGDFELALSPGNRTTGEQIMLRLLTSPAMSAEAGFYLDAIDLRLGFDQSLVDKQANKIYLPLVTGGGGAPAAATTARSKAEVLAEVNAASSSCPYHCLDLNLLQSTYIKTIGASQLWNVAPYLRGENVTVAVVDSGIAPHPDLNDYYGNSRLIAQVNFVPGSDVPDDFYGHGTHIAGTIAGLGVSSGGAYLGVAPEARLVDVKVTDDYGMGNTSDVVAGLQWIYNHRNNYNIKIANLSLNSTVPESYHASALDAALEVLWFNKIVVVVSAGNEGKEKLYPPANDPFAIVVGSMDDKGTVDTADDKLSSFSAYGMTSDGFLKPDLVAPGQNIVSLLASDDMNLKRTLPLNSILGYQNKYFKMSGTSMASAVVAGAVALLLEDEPHLTPDQVKARLLLTARPTTANNSVCATGSGYLDIYAAVHSQSTQSANTGIQASQLLWSGTNPITWGSVSWNSVSWNSVSWNSVSWNSVSWNSVSWNSVSWNSNSSNNDKGNVDCGAAFSGFTLVNAQTNQDIQPLYENAIIDLDQINSNSLTVRADTVGPIKSVKFKVNNGFYTKVENIKPYTLYGDNNGNYAGVTFYPGAYQTEVSAYSENNASGTLLARQEYQTILTASWYTPRLQSVANNLCLQPPWGSWNAGAQMAQGICGTESAQKFRIKVVPGQQNLVNLVNARNGLCLDIHSASMASGAQAIQWSCHGNENQQFLLKGVGDNAYQIIAVHSGKCLALKTDSFYGSEVIQTTCNQSDAKQQWRLN